PLLALGAQAVRKQSEVDVGVAAPFRGLLDVLHLVDEDLLRVEQQPADQRRLAVVDRAARDEAEELRGLCLFRNGAHSGTTTRPCLVPEWALKIADTLAVLHRGFGEAVVGAGLAALGDTRRCDLVDDLRDRRRVADDAAGAGHVTDGAETHRGGEEILAVHALDVVRARVEHAVAPEDLALMGEVDPRELEILTGDVLPHVELRPVRNRKDADVLAFPHARVVDVPELRTLRTRVPLAEVVAEAEDALLGSGALLVAPCAADRRVELVLLDRVEQRRRL